MSKKKKPSKPTKKKYDSKYEEFFDKLKDIKISESMIKPDKSSKSEKPFKPSDEGILAQSLVSLWFYKPAFPNSFKISAWIHGPGNDVFQTSYQMRQMVYGDIDRYLSSVGNWFVLSLRPWPQIYSKVDNVAYLMQVAAPVWGVYMPDRLGESLLTKLLRKLPYHATKFQPYGDTDPNEID